MNFKKTVAKLPGVPQVRTKIRARNRHRETTREKLQTSNDLLAATNELLKASVAALEAVVVHQEAARTLAAESNVIRNTQNDVLNQQVEIAKQTSGAAQKASKELEGLSVALEGIRLAATEPIRSEMESLIGPKQLSMLDTINMISSKRMSFARYGDGEIRLMLREEFNLRFQKNAPGLKSDLARVFNMSSDTLLIGMPHRFVNSMWGAVFAENWSSMKPVVEKAPIFGDSHVSRPIFFDFYQQAAVDAWRSVWEGRDALIVAGRGSRFELIEALFDNLGETSLVEGAPKHSYVEIESIWQDIIENLNGKDLVLIALGPSGTILAARLAEIGVQAIDIGHISASYRAVFSGDLFPELQPVSQLEASAD